MSDQSLAGLELPLPKLRKALIPSFRDMGFVAYKSFFIRENEELRQVLSVRKENSVPDFYALQWNLLIEFRNDDRLALSISIRRNAEENEICTVRVHQHTFDEVLANTITYINTSLRRVVEATRSPAAIASLSIEQQKEVGIAWIQRFNPTEALPPPLPWFERS
jgi:hypothetical protein